MDPELIKLGYKIVNDDYSLRRKVEGEYSAKECFLIDRTKPIPGQQGKFYFNNKFGTPYGLDFILINNGKMDCVDVLYRAIEVLIESLDLFENEIILGKASEIIGQLDVKDNNEQVLNMPKTSNMNLLESDNGKYSLFIDDSLLNMISTKVMEIVDDIIGEDLNKWSMTSIYYKVPHRLINAAELHVKIPDDDEFTSALIDRFAFKGKGSDLINELIIKAIEHCREQLSFIRNSVQSAVNN